MSATKELEQLERPRIPALEVGVVEDVGGIATADALADEHKIKLNATRLFVGEYLLTHEDPDSQYWVFDESTPEFPSDLIGSELNPNAANRDERVRGVRDALNFFEANGMGEARKYSIRKNKPSIINFRLKDFGRSVIRQNIIEANDEDAAPRSSAQYTKEPIDSLIERLDLMQREIDHINGSQYDPLFISTILNEQEGAEDPRLLRERLVGKVAAKEKELNSAIDTYDEQRKPIVEKRAILDNLLMHAEGFFVMMDCPAPKSIRRFRETESLTEDQIDGAIASCRKFIKQVEDHKEDLVPTSELVG